jgi:polysaccharide biosynthesis protein PelA
MKKLLLLLLTLSALLDRAFANPTCQQNSLYCNWISYYNNQAAPAEFRNYNPLVLDADRHPDLTPLRSMGKTLLGYVSLGEVSTTRSYFTEAQNAKLLIAPNPNYPGSWYVDIRQPAWTNLMIQKVIPSILKQGFQGLLLDTLDIPIYLEQVNNPAYIGMTQAAIDLVIAIRTAFPQIPLMLDRAYPILNEVGSYINFALGESVLTTYNFSTNLYYYLTLAEYTSQVTYLQKAQAAYPHLVVMSLDYWNPADPATVRKIYHAERKNGFRPYVSTISLHQITPEP